MFLVLLGGPGVDQDVVKVANHKIVEIRSKTFVDICLERGRGVGEAEGHYPILELAIACAECGFVFVAFFDSDEVLSAA